MRMLAELEKEDPLLEQAISEHRNAVELEKLSRMPKGTRPGFPNAGESWESPN